MDVRPISLTDAEDVRDVAERSMQTSYALGPGTIAAAVEEWYGKEPLAEKIDADDRCVLVCDGGDGVAGVVEAAVPEEPTGEIVWLHVDPDFRGDGLGRELFERAREWLEDAGADRVRGLVLAENADGTAFYRSLGLERVGDREVEIDGTTYTEYVFREDGGDDLEVRRDGDREVYVDREDPRHGSIDPFYVAFVDPDGNDRYGYVCGHCDALETAMDAMGRVECQACGNTHKPTRWDAAYM